MTKQRSQHVFSIGALAILLMGCTREVKVGVEDLPADSQFRLELSKYTAVSAENVWSFSSVSAGEHRLKLFYGKHECMLTSPTVVVAKGVGALYHKTNWQCPGLIGYKTISVSSENGTFAMGKSEVTVGLWQQLMGEEGEDPCGVECPKSEVSWMQVLQFANQLSILEGLEQCYTNGEKQEIAWNSSCNGWRLPTDEEWSLAAAEADFAYAGSNDPKEVGWYKDNSHLRRHPVCQLKTTASGFCDLTGNVWEWNWDASPKNEHLRRVRGGGYSSRDVIARLDNKIDFPRHIGADHIGFRLVRSE